MKAFIRTFHQWRIQDFPGEGQWGGANLKCGGINLLFWLIFPKNCMKVKKWKGASAAPFGSANAHLHSFCKVYVWFHLNGIYRNLVTTQAFLVVPDLITRVFYLLVIEFTASAIRWFLWQLTDSRSKTNMDGAFKGHSLLFRYTKIIHSNYACFK